MLSSDGAEEIRRRLCSIVMKV